MGFRVKPAMTDFRRMGIRVNSQSLIPIVGMDILIFLSSFG